MTTTAAPDAIPLVPRRRLLGTASGGATSLRRGGGTDVATSRPYRPGDHVRSIDWKTSARVSAARAVDAFVVRERHAEEMPAVVLVVDRRPSMRLYPADLPWLHKPAAVRAAVRLLVASATNQRSLVAYLDHAEWEPPRAQANVWSVSVADRIDDLLDGGFDAPEDAVAEALDVLATRRSSVPIGSFVFVLSDFTTPVPFASWAGAVGLGWDVVPVIVQDPVWEQSFPAIDGVLATVADVNDGRLRRVRLDRRQVARRRAENEERLAGLRDDFVRLGLDPVVVGSSDPIEVHATFLAWAHARLELKRGAL